MKEMNIETERVKLVLQMPEETQALIEGMTPLEKAELSADWLALVDSATLPDPWVHGFTILRRADNVIVGSCGFKGPPTDDGVVEIAYGVAADHQNNGYATEAAQALTSYAFGDSAVRIVRAHTLPEINASTKVLTKCGFEKVGQVIDSDDGLVWRWERRHETR
jgi:RimJ/RimL family protein N-acetyltransferase